jgi:hypothetical protein
MGVGLGHFILPKPNRLVVICGNTYHTINASKWQREKTAGARCPAFS